MAMRSRHFRVLLLTLGCAGAIGACNAIAGLGEDFVVDPSRSDGSLPTNEAGSDGQSGDGGTDAQASDAPTDTFVPDGATGPFCASADSGTNGKGYCWDFESADGPPSFGWSGKLSPTGYAMDVIADAGAAGSRGLDVTLTQSTGSKNGWLFQTLPFAGAPNAFSHMELEFDFNVVSVTALYATGLGMLTFPAVSADVHEFGVSQYKTGSTVSRLSVEGSEAALVKGTWQRAKIVLDRPDGAVDFVERVTVGVVEVDTQTGIKPGTGATEIRLGLFSTSGENGSIHAKFDNVVLRRW